MVPADCPLVHDLVALSLFRGLSGFPSWELRTSPGLSFTDQRVAAGASLTPVEPLVPRGELEAGLTGPLSFAPVRLSLGFRATYDGATQVGDDGHARLASLLAEAGLGTSVPTGGALLRPSAQLSLGPGLLWGRGYVENERRLVPRLLGGAGLAWLLPAGLRLAAYAELPLIRLRYGLGGGATASGDPEPLVRVKLSLGWWSKTQEVEDVPTQ